MSEFSAFLKQKRDEKGLTNSKLASRAKISAVYLGEILKNKKNPPDKKTQYALVEALDLEERDKISFYDLAAKERNEIPVDVYDFLLMNLDMVKKIRICKKEVENEKY